MTAPRTRAGLSLGPIVLFGAIIALIVGILGMHVMTGTHSLHAAGAVSSAGTDSAAPGRSSHGGHSSHGASLEEPTTHSAPPVTTQCSCSGSCSAQHAMGVSGIPLAATGTLSAPAPDSTPAVAQPYLGTAVAASGLWTYSPGSPSPGDLSISRT